MKVLIYDRYPMLSTFVRKLIEDELHHCEVAVTGYPSKDKSALSPHYDIVVITISKEDTINFTLDLIREISAVHPESRLLVFDIGNPNYREMPLYFREGGWGYISLSYSVDNIKACLNRLYEGQRFIPYEGMEWILDNHKDIAGPNVKYRVKSKPFTPSELSVAKALIRGKRVSDIARDSDRKISTISSLKKKLMDKVGVDNIIELRTVMQSMEETAF